MKRGGLVVELLGMVLECASPPLPVVVRIDVSRETHKTMEIGRASCRERV